MALLTKILDRASVGRRIQREVEITFDAYVTGGRAWGARDVEMSQVTSFDFSHAKLGAAHSDNVVRYDAVNGKVRVLTAAGVEIANATDLSTFVATAIVRGRR